MTEWEVVGVIIALFGFIITVIKPIVNLNTSITKLSTLMDSVSNDLKSLTSDNKASHDRIWRHNDEQDSMLSDHDHRITVLETKKD